MDKELEAIKQIVDALESLEVEEKKRVLDYVFNRLGLKSIKTEQPSQFNLVPSIETFNQPVASRQEDVIRTTPTTIKDIRTLKEEKQPQSAIQMVVLVAYYLSEIAPLDERKDTISSEDITKYFKQANFALPKGEPIYTLRNARNAGYFDPTSETGVYRLNPVGYNLAAHNLPSGTGNGSAVKTKKAKKAGMPKKKKGN